VPDASSPIPAVQVKLGPMDPGQIADLRLYFESVPDPRSRRGRWYSLTAVLLVCACAVVAGARSIDELAERGARASGELLRGPGCPAASAALAAPWPVESPLGVGR
jgi:hypothetical protein